MVMIDVTPHARSKAVANGIVRVLVHVCLGYLVGMALSEHIYADLSRTDWSNLWVYFWLFFWPFGLFWMFTFYSVIALMVIGGAFWLYRFVWLGR